MLKFCKWFLQVVSIMLLISACGGGGGSEPTATTGGGLVAKKIVSWTPPTTYTDNSPLDPARDLSHYEIFFNQNRSTPDAIVSAVDHATGQAVVSFDLANLGPFFSKSTNSITMRSVTLTGEPSDYSSPVSFTI